jgi:hypothetical protein
MKETILCMHKIIQIYYIFNYLKAYRQNDSHNGSIIQILNIVMQAKSMFHWLEAHSLIGRPY